MGTPAIHPGEHLAEELKALDMSASTLARQLSVPTNRITEILNGRRAITGDTALRLAHFFGTSAEFWAQPPEALRAAACRGTGGRPYRLPADAQELRHGTLVSPWHEVVQLRDDLKSGELSLAVFAADLYDVVMQKGHRPVYEQPAPFFALTYPTLNLRELVKDVALRLAGRSDKAYRKLAVNYGGGKTHTLIALRHLVHDPGELPDLPAVREFEGAHRIQGPAGACRGAVLRQDRH